jgi:hypothetical protein
MYYVPRLRSMVRQSGITTIIRKIDLQTQFVRANESDRSNCKGFYSKTQASVDILGR